MAKLGELGDDMAENDGKKGDKGAMKMAMCG